MEPLDVNWMDELLRDFSGDVILPAPRSSSSRRHHHRGAGAGAAPPSQEERRRQSPPAWSAPIVHPSLLDGPATDPSPGFVEEELEWLSNKEAFPSLETFDVYAYRKPSSPAPPPSLAAAEGGSKRPSPVSVLAKGFLPAASPFLQRTPRRARSQGQQRRRRVLPVFPSSRSSPGEEKRRCWHCGAGETPQWRAGPHGPKTLCNACGVRYKSGRLVPEYRPASSPTFSSALHSNSHRKIMEMRRRKEGQAHSAAGGGGAAPTTANKKKKKKRKRKGLRLL